MRRGDLTALEVIVENYRQPIISYASRFLGDPTEAHDVAQNVFVQVFKQAHRFQLKSKISTWLYAIARNLCRNEYRRRLRQRTDVFDESMPEGRSTKRMNSKDPQHANIPESVFEGELQEKIEESLAYLPENQRNAMVLLYEQDLSYDEIAAQLTTSVSAIKSIIHRARQQLKRQLRPYLQTGAWAAETRSIEVPQSLGAPGPLARGHGYSRPDALVGIGDCADPPVNMTAR
jgi:RNA polymerase sigma-70 factor (ECF subfamily)